MFRLNRSEEAALLSEARRHLDRCGLAAQSDTPAASLPLAQQRIVEIARALAGQPHVLLLDEPAAGLRQLEKRELVKLLQQLRSEGMALLVVEHDMAFVMGVADVVTVLDFGQVIAHGTPEQVKSQPRVLQAYLGVEDAEVQAA
jgi:branched-chain amino acid transport system permease protein